MSNIIKYLAAAIFLSTPLFAEQVDSSENFNDCVQNTIDHAYANFDITDDLGLLLSARKFCKKNPYIPPVIPKLCEPPKISLGGRCVDLPIGPLIIKKIADEDKKPGAKAETNQEDE